MSFYPSAAAAEAAGFRPCLRCRPETVPFSPAWMGSLINDGALDEEGVELLAERLIGARHLSRLFEEHVGASLTQVAKTARVQRAKRLLDQTDLPRLTLRCVPVLAAFGGSMPFLAKSTGGRQPRSATRFGNKTP